MTTIFKDRARKSLTKKANKGYSGHPIATIAFYGPTDAVATKVAVSIILEKDAPPDVLKRWFSEKDVRSDPAVLEQVLKFISEKSARSVVMPDRIIGCPHEEGIDYPNDETCPACTFWKNRDRWTGKLLAKER